MKLKRFWNWLNEDREKKNPRLVAFLFFIMIVSVIIAPFAFFAALFSAVIESVLK
ncbi:hypothetical protein [Bacillus sp. FJAT-27264]|uniref:hypothetical protein n=1 Tax=Paenibacillus sp. (strain DSM 101736 / FJAT-27264) TaxID=1850362 RepID=UPI0015861DE0|nr:hypothetical protein [Bacillus sp. FJAT-27264]